MSADAPDLIARCLRGDDAAFTALHAEHAGRVKAYFLRQGFTGPDADDLTQQVFVRVFKSFRTFDRSRGTFSQWLGAIARNVARKHFRRRTQPQSFDPELAEEMFAAMENPTGRVELREEIDALSQCIEALPAELARVIHLRYVQARTTRGIAALLGMPEATVRLRLKEAAGLLQGCLKAKGIFE